MTDKILHPPPDHQTNFKANVCIKNFVLRQKSKGESLSNKQIKEFLSKLKASGSEHLAEVELKYLLGSAQELKQSSTIQELCSEGNATATPTRCASCVLNCVAMSFWKNFIMKLNLFG